MKKLLFALIFFIGLSFAVLGFGSFLNKQKVASITNFDECAAAGYPIMESYPARCMTPDKRTFTQELTEDDLPAGRQEIVPSNTCGNGICESITCDAIGCPNAETPVSCPQDCPYDR